MTHAAVCPIDREARMRRGTFLVLVISAVTSARSLARGDTPADGVDSAAPGTAMLVLEVGLDAGGRRFSYDGTDASTGLRSYGVDSVPGLHLGVEVYPLAADPDRLLAKLGVEARYTRVLRLSSRSTAGSGAVDIDTDWTQVIAGARIRHTAGRASFSGGVGYGASVFEFDDPPAEIADGLPDASYTFTYVAADGRLDQGPFAAFGGAEVLVVGKPGGVGERFRHASTTGFGMHAGIAVRVTHHVEMRGVARYRRFDSTYRHGPGDELVADTGTDHQYNVRIGWAFIF